MRWHGENLDLLDELEEAAGMLENGGRLVKRSIDETDPDGTKDPMKSLLCGMALGVASRLRAVAKKMRGDA